ncbi:MAG: CHAT domain-containing protein, partial [Thermoguttaceae bacterium]
WQLQVIGLTEMKEELEARLSSPDTPERVISLTDVQDVLQGDEALIDFLEYDRLAANGKDTHRFLLAFVLTRQSMRMLDLGPTEPIHVAVRECLAAVEGKDKTARYADGAKRLRRLVWDRIEPEVAGVRLCIVCPDGQLGRVPLSSLPGNKHGEYLLHKWLFVRTLHPYLFVADRLSEETSEPSGQALLVGNVDFDINPYRPMTAKVVGKNETVTLQVPVSSRKGLRFGHLPETEVESRDIAARLGRGEVRLLQGAKATEDEFRKYCSTARYIHLATHGFYEVPGIVRETRQAWQKFEEFEKLNIGRPFFLNFDARLSYELGMGRGSPWVPTSPRNGARCRIAATMGY